MEKKGRTYIEMVGVMLVLQLLLNGWEVAIGNLFSVGEPFERKMVTMVGMLLLTALTLLLSRQRKTDLSLCPRKMDGVSRSVILLSVAMLLSTVLCFTKGTHGLLLLCYGSLVTPLFEELLFRGHLFNLQERIHAAPYQVVLLNALLFSVWHIGYIVQPLMNGEWMALSKLVIALFYGLLLATIRWRTKSTLCSFLAHGALNACLG